MNSLPSPPSSPVQHLPSRKRKHARENDYPEFDENTKRNKQE